MWFTSDHASMMAGVVVVFLLLTVFGIGQRSTLGGEQWFVVPGGLLIRKARRFGHNCRLHLFDRCRSALIVHRIRRHYWIAFVADGEAHYRATMTPHEATLLLRAWLSPLSPPPLERLSDLA